MSGILTFKKAPQGRFLRLRASDRRHARGFTLVELVTTIVIVSVLAAVAAPYLFDTRAFSERGYVEEVAFAVRYAQKIAIASQCDTQVSINAGAYAGMQQAACNTGNWTTPIRRTDGEALAGTPPANVALAPNVIIAFDRNGIASAPTVLTVGAFTVSVDAPSGLVTVLP